jgi:signal transduction histidine kinase
MATTSSQAFELVQAAATQRTLDGIGDMLARLCSYVGAFGCMMWSVRPTDTDKPINESALYATAQWFPNGIRCHLDRLPCDGSLVGNAFTLRKLQLSLDIWADHRVFKGDRFLKRQGIKTMLALPLQDNGTIVGVINFYYRPPAERPDSKRASELSALVPHLAQVIRDRVGMQLMLDVGGYLESLHGTANEAHGGPEAAEVFLTKVCRAISSAFNCLETSIFLGTQTATENEFALAATSWKRMSEFTKREYWRGENNLTGTVLTSGRAVSVFNLLTLYDDVATLPTPFRGVQWSDSLSIEAAVRRTLSLGKSDPTPPISYMASPIMTGGMHLGVIRCCAPVCGSGTHSFTSMELELLKAIAKQVAGSWDRWLRAREAQQETRAWRSAVDGFAMMNRRVQEQLSAPNEQRASVVGPPLDVIRNSTRDYAELQVDWGHGPGGADPRRSDAPSEQRASPTLKKSDFRIKLAACVREERSRGNRCVIEDDELLIAFRALHASGYEYGAHAGVVRAVAPIRVHDRIYGVLDISRKDGVEAMPRHVTWLLRLAGLQLGLYRFLADAVGQLDRQAHEQRQVYEDLNHQISSPISQIRVRVDSLPHGDVLQLEPEQRSALHAIGALSKKALRVMRNLDLFVALAKDEDAKATTQFLKEKELLNVVREAVDDNNACIEPGTDIRIVMDRIQTRIPIEQYPIDRGFLEQALNIVLDNAVKYSFRSTVIHLGVNLTSDRRLRFTIQNEGLAIRGTDIENSIKRGWRGQEAKLTTSEGSGIGLWIAWHIMKAHAGTLLLLPTNKNDVTEVQMLFPSKDAR